MRISDWSQTCALPIYRGPYEWIEAFVCRRAFDFAHAAGAQDKHRPARMKLSRSRLGRDERASTAPIRSRVADRLRQSAYHHYHVSDYLMPQTDKRGARESFSRILRLRGGRATTKRRPQQRVGSRYQRFFP